MSRKKFLKNKNPLGLEGQASLEQAFRKSLSKRSSAQASLEYLLLLAAFFSALALILPALSSATQSFFSANDTILAKQVAEQLQEQCSLFFSLADGSKSVLEFVPSKSIAVFSEGNNIVIASADKEFSVSCANAQFVPRQEFSTKFFAELTKSNNLISISFHA